MKAIFNILICLITLLIYSPSQALTNEILSKKNVSKSPRENQFLNTRIIDSMKTYHILEIISNVADTYHWPAGYTHE